MLLYNFHGNRDTLQLLEEHVGRDFLLVHSVTDSGMPLYYNP